MKYVALVDEVRCVLASFGRRHFDPYRFDGNKVAAMLELLQRRRSTPESPACVGMPSAGDVPFDGGSDAARLARLAFGLAVTALLSSPMAVVLASRR